MTTVKAQSSLSVREAHKHQEAIEDMVGEQTTTLMSDKIKVDGKLVDAHSLVIQTPKENIASVRRKLRDLGWKIGWS